jgi:hypothetical protein
LQHIEGNRQVDTFGKTLLPRYKERNVEPRYSQS